MANERGAHLLELKNVSKQFEQPGAGETRDILHNISLELTNGQSLSIMGPSGSGKSTLLNIIGALDRPTSGEVQIEGRSLTGLNDIELAKLRNTHIGFVFQAHHLLPQCTVLENVLVPTIPQKGQSKAIIKRAKQLIDRVGLKDRIEQLPSQLSGGECQRVAVVRALINQPSLLLADEPTGSLDGATAADLGELLVELNHEERIALIVVTHSADLAGMMAATAKLAGGRLEI